MTKTEKPYHHKDLRKALIAAGLDIISTRGIQELSLRETARVSGVTHAAPYRHFATKNELVKAITVQEYYCFLEKAQSIYAAHRPGTKEAFAGAWFYFIDYALDNANRFRLLFNESYFPLSGDETTLMEEPLQQLIQFYRTTVDDAQHSGLLKSQDPMKLAVALFTSFFGIAIFVTENARYMFPDTSKKSMRALAQELFDIQCAGYFS